MFSKTCEYAIRAMIFIAQHSKDGKCVAIREIAKGIDSPEYFIAKILQDMSRKGLVSSVKGPNGGFYLDKESLKYSIADVVIRIDGNKIFTACGLGLNQCSESHPCPMHGQYQKLRKSLSEMLRAAKIGKLSKQIEQTAAYLKTE